MKKIKVILALVLVAALFVTLFAACAQNEEPSGNNTNAAGNNTNNDTVSGDDEDLDEETAEISFAYLDMRGYGGDHGERVGAAIDAYCREKINVGVKVNYMGMGDWQSKVNVAVSAGERLDVMCLFYNAITSAYANNLLMDATDYLNEYAAETLELVKDYVGAFTHDGRIYGLPTLRNYVKNGYILFREDLLEQYGLVEQAKAIDSWSDYEAVMKAMVDGGLITDQNIYPTRGATGDFPSFNYLSTDDNFANIQVFDNLGDGTSMVYCDQDGNVSLLPAQAGYVYELKLMADWTAKGYNWPETSVSDQFVDDSIRYGSVASYIGGSEVGVEVTKTQTWTYPCLAVPTVSSMIKTSQAIFSGIGIPITCEEPEAAAKFLNLMYTDPKLMNLICWGVEGEDYTVENGEVVYGEDPHFMGADFVMGNSLILTPMQGNGADFYEKVAEINVNAPVSKYLGFAIDTGDLQQYIANIGAVTDQYNKTLTSGGYTEEIYAEFMDKLEAADVQGYLDAVQQQLNAWIAAN